MKKILVLLLSFIFIFGLVACTEAVDPTTEYPAMNKLSISSSYKGNREGNFFTFKFNWKEEDSFRAKYSHDYDLYWSMDEMGPYELCEPKEGYTTTCELYTLVPGETSEFTINVDDKYENLPQGFYKFVFKFYVSENDSEPILHEAYIDFNI